MIEALIQKIEEWFMQYVLPVILNILLWVMRITLLWAFITMMGLAYNEAVRAITEWIGSIS
mgnify:CR=1 FL=1